MGVQATYVSVKYRTEVDVVSRKLPAGWLGREAPEATILLFPHIPGPRIDMEISSMHDNDPEALYPYYGEPEAVSRIMLGPDRVSCLGLVYQRGARPFWVDANFSDVVRRSTHECVSRKALSEIQTHFRYWLLKSRYNESRLGRFMSKVSLDAKLVHRLRVTKETHSARWYALQDKFMVHHVEEEDRLRIRELQARVNDEYLRSNLDCSPGKGGQYTEELRQIMAHFVFGSAYDYRKYSLAEHYLHEGIEDDWKSLDEDRLDDIAQQLRFGGKSYEELVKFHSADTDWMVPLSRTSRKSSRRGSATRYGTVKSTVAVSVQVHQRIN